MAIELSRTFLADDANLLAYWQFESDGSDSSGNSKTLTGNNSPTFVAGKFNNAVDLERTSSQTLSRADDVDFDFGTGAFSVSAWFNAESISQFMGVISKIDGGDANGWRLNIDSDNTASFLVNSSVGAADSASTTTTISASTWYHVCATRSGSTIKIFLNGSLEDTVTGSAHNLANAEVIAIGAYRSADLASNLFDGQIDDVAVFNRALSDDEAKSLYLSQVISLTESIGVSESQARTSNVTRTTLSDLALVDSLDARAVLLLSLTDNLSLSDVSDRVAEYSKEVAEAIGVSEAVVSDGEYARGVLANIGITDANSYSYLIAREIADSIDVSDALVFTTLTPDGNRIKFILIKAEKPKLKEVS